MPDEPDMKALIAEIVALTARIEAMRHVHLGRHNRLFGYRQRAAESLDRHAAAEQAYTILFRQPETAVREFAAIHCMFSGIAYEAAQAVMRELALRPDQIGRDARSFLAEPIEERRRMTRAPHPAPKPITYAPMPPGCTRGKVESLIRAGFSPERARPIVDLLRRSARLWPQKSGTGKGLSRFGGMPSVQAGWKWPFEFDEPKLFLAQIDCAELHAAVGSTVLPPYGLLSFFGDYDDVHGCGPTGASAVYYFQDPASLRPASVPLDGFEPLINCDMGFYKTFDLPHFHSRVVTALGLSEGESDAYYKIWDQLARFGFPAVGRSDYVSKLFGWPDLVQSDLGEVIRSSTEPTPNLLLQIGWYHDGWNWESWGPGGTLYFTLDEKSIAARRFSHAELEVQCT